MCLCAIVLLCPAIDVYLLPHKWRPCVCVCFISYYVLFYVTFSCIWMQCLCGDPLCICIYEVCYPVCVWWYILLVFGICTIFYHKSPIHSYASCVCITSFYVLMCAWIEFEYIDLGSTYGTRINGYKVLRAYLRFGDKIRVGRSTILFCDVDSLHADEIGDIVKPTNCCSLM